MEPGIAMLSDLMRSSCGAPVKFAADDPLSRKSTAQVTPIGCPSHGAVRSRSARAGSSFSLLVSPDRNACGRCKDEAWHVEVLRRWLVPENAASEVVGRAMARAEKTAWPVVRETGLRAFLESCPGCAAQMRADADDNEEIPMIGTRPVLVPAVVRQGHRERMSCGRVCDHRIRRDHICQHSVGPVDEKHRHAAPGDRHHFAATQIADICVDRCACCLGPLGRRERIDKRHKSSHPRNAPRNRRCDQPPATVVVHTFPVICCHGTPPCCRCPWFFDPDAVGPFCPELDIPCPDGPGHHVSLRDRVRLCPSRAGAAQVHLACRVVSDVRRRVNQREDNFDVLLFRMALRTPGQYLESIGSYNTCKRSIALLAMVASAALRQQSN
ncbi:hypothetical protein BX589_114216 [Paraburkholderia fungorum]|jgi:hypothetical protein|nr:hypothetical protein BX589_114216 [Paraburkholderia fungorum]